jgi:hypothetical protein
MKPLDEQMLNTIGFGGDAGKIMSIRYGPMGVRAYHMHRKGNAWIPTAPKQANGASDVEISDLTESDFFSNLPTIILQNSSLKRWFARRTIMSSVYVDKDEVTIRLEQSPAIEGVRNFTIRGRISRPLSFLDGKAVLDIAMTDCFGLGRKLRIYHDGHQAAKVGIQHSTRFNGIIHVTSDGVRERFVYRPNRTSNQIATLYLKDPTSLYSLEGAVHDDQTRLLFRELRPDFMLKVSPLRNLEWMMLDNGNAYDHGTIGAEVAHTIASKMLMSNQLLLLEPAMRGSDVVSRDRSIAIEARMLASSRARTAAYAKLEAAPHLRQMVGRLRWGLSQKAFKRGIAIMCIRLSDTRIVALVKEA